MADADVQEILRRSPLLAGAPAGLVPVAAGRCEAVLLAAHQRLLTAGLPNARLYIVLSGSLSVHASGGAPPSFVRFGPSDCVGELSLLENGPASADVVADQSSVLAAFDRDAIWTLVDASPDVARNVLSVLAGRDQRPTAAAPVRPEGGGNQHPTIDSLTGLRNRRWMDDAFARQIERSSRTAQPSSILLIEIDHFATLHADHGPVVADAVLCRTANVLVAALRPQDLVARSGSAQFAVLLPGLDAPASIAVAERLRRTVEARRPGTDEADLLMVTVSIGRTPRRPFEALPALVRRAEAALQRAQESGCNRSSE